MQLILASQSPRRRELLSKIGKPFQVEAADIDETMDPKLPPRDEVARVSREKARVVAEKHPEAVVIAADTIVVCQDHIMGKPHSEKEAGRMLKMLSGKCHQVMTGLTVRQGEKVLSCTEVTDVQFRTLSDREIGAYVRTGEPMDKAGAYAIQGGGAFFAAHISGDYYNVVGLPLCRLGRLLQSVAPEIMEEFA